MRVYPLIEPLLRQAALRLSRPLITEAKTQVNHLLIAFSLTATGISCIVVGLTYFASALWQGFVPLLGTVGADMLLGGRYALIAGLLIYFGFRAVR